MDDPKYINPHDLIYRSAGSLVEWSVYLAEIAMIAMLPTMIASRLSGSRVRRWAWFLVLVAGLAAVWYDPGRRLEWWID